MEAQELSHTLFEGLIERYPWKSEMLTIQYRMNERIMEFPSKEFYDGRIVADERVKNITLGDLGIKVNATGIWRDILDPSNVLVFIDTCMLDNRFERQRREAKAGESIRG